MPRSTVQVALGVGVGGALEDVSSYVQMPAGLTRTFGRNDSFFGLRPGSFDFVLDNADGRFTPDNATSPLSTKMAEGVRACVNIGGRLTAGTVRTLEPEFPGDDAAWARVRVTCEDVLGSAARTQLRSAADSLVWAARPLFFWKMDEEEGAPFAVDSGPNNVAPLAGGNFASYAPRFGGPALPWVGDTQMFGGSDAGSEYSRLQSLVTVADFGYAAGSGGSYGFWYTPISNTFDSTTHFQFITSLNGGQAVRVRKGSSGPSGRSFLTLDFASFSPIATSRPLQDLVPVYVAVTIDIDGGNLRARMYVDGVLEGTVSEPALSTTSAGLTPFRVRLELTSTGSASSYLISRLSHTQERVNEHLVRDVNDVGDLLRVVEAATPGLVLDSLPSNLSGANVELPDFEGASSLDVLDEFVLAEQGHVYPRTSGTLLAPTETLVVRSRERPRSASYTFDVTRELAGAPRFVRDVTNLVSSARAAGPNGEVVQFDRTLTARAGNAVSSDRLAFGNSVDLRDWASDRIARGANTSLGIASVVVDAMTTPTDRSADLLNLAPGDRVRFTSLPSNVLGFSTWDGWFLGSQESHTIEGHTFELFFEPVLPDAALYDSDRFVDSVLTLSAGISSAATSMSIATTGAQLTTVDLPLTVLVDAEQITVTACTAATPQVATVTRAANGTAAAAHSAGAAVTVLPDSVYAF